MFKWESCLLVADGRSVQPGQSVCDSDWTRNRGWCKSVSVCEWTESPLEGIRIRRATRTCRRGPKEKEDQKVKSTRKRGEKFMQQRYQKANAENTTPVKKGTQMIQTMRLISARTQEVKRQRQSANKEKRIRRINRVKTTINNTELKKHETRFTN